MSEIGEFSSELVREKVMSLFAEEKTNGMKTNDFIGNGPSLAFPAVSFSHFAEISIRALVRFLILMST